MIAIIRIGVWLNHRFNFNEPTRIQIKFLYVFMLGFIQVIHNVTVKGERSFAVRTYPNIV
ncbi:MAG: hypothetical protein ACJ71L_09170 [Nitrososphaeraceae archaeon]